MKFELAITLDLEYNICSVKEFMLFFSIENLERASCSDPIKLIALLKFHMEGKTIPSKRDKIKPSTISLKGSSFLVNPRPLLNNKSVDPYFIAQYIRLAAKRDYTMYSLYKQTSLPKSYYIDIDFEKLKHNPLFRITDTEIIFKYEG